MELEIKRKSQKIKSKSFIENFTKELRKTLEKRNKNNIKTKKENIEKQESTTAKEEMINNCNNKKTKEEKTKYTKLTDEEKLEFEKREFKFLENFFTEELKDLSKGEAFIITDKYENDPEYNRYKITQYKNHMECKHVILKKDLPPNAQLRDIVRKKNEQYTYDAKATEYIKKELEEIKQGIINEREN